MKLRILFIFLVVAFFTGCSSNPFVEYSVSPSKKKYTAWLMPYGNTIQSSKDWDLSVSNLPKQGIGGVDSFLAAGEALTNSGLFEEVYVLGGSDADIKILMNFRAKNEDITLVDFTKMMLQAATVFLVPMPYERTYFSTFRIYKASKLLGSFTYERTSSEFISIFGNSANDVKNYAAASMATEMLKDLVEKNLL